MSMVESVDPIEFTDAAAANWNMCSEEEVNNRRSLGGYVSGGGSGVFQYGFAMEEEHHEDESEVKRHGVTLVGAPLSFQYLVGSQVDYKENLEGSRFVVQNPNATSTCGCGASFSI